MKGVKMRKNFFTIDNDIFNLKLDSYEFQIYCYLVCCAGKNGVCWPSYQTMARLLGISSNTVVNKIGLLVAKHLIEKENTTSKCKNGKTRTSNNRYYILPFEDAWNYAFRYTPKQ
jgi:hypothetical protein